MKLDANDNLPLYLQFKAVLKGKIMSGEYKPGGIIPTEIELCKEYGISRFPVRQAMEELVNEGFLQRTRGKGTFVSLEAPVGNKTGSKRLGLMIHGIGGRYSVNIVNGFEKYARKCGYLTILHSSDGNADEELAGIKRITDNGIDGIVVFPCDNSKLDEAIGDITSKGIYASMIDRNPGIRDIDYINSDNIGGTYSAVSHLAMQGFSNVSFVSFLSEVSSVNERLEGYLKAVDDFGLKAITHISLEEDPGKARLHKHRFLIERLREELSVIKDNLPCGIFAVNDGIALECMKIVSEVGLVVGRDVAIVGFDNEPEGAYASTPLTTVEQNGLLIGSTSAEIAIGKIEGRYCGVYRSIIPTQLVIRKSCGEGK